MIVDPSILEQTNPVFNTAKMTLYLLSRAGDADAAAIVDKLGLTLEEPQNSATTVALSEQIVAGARERLNENGWLILEHGWKQAAQIRDLLVRAGFAHVRSHPDLAGHERVTEGCVLKTS